MSKPKVLSLGALAMDIVISGSALPQNDGFALIQSELLTPGGSAANMSVALGLMGAEVYQTGKIGDDSLGRAFRADLVLQGINADYLAEKAGGVTLHTYVLTAPDGQHCILANLGDCVTNLEPEDLPDGILTGFSCFYTDMFSPRASLWLGQKALELKIPVVYNMQCAPSFMAMCGVERRLISEMLGLATVVVSGRDGYFELTGETDERAALAAMIAGYKCPPDGFICTVGGKGALWHNGRDIETVPAFPVSPRDTTGAGDCFSAGLIFSRYCDARPMGEALRLACASAALKCLEPGPRTKASLSAIETLIKEVYGE
ncbi:MAG: carbohydrate kinase family protein [Peptococcaceae bacterium]|nr:carbohydrate kinase family protein [Peptococcaceae bacterium]